MVDLGDPFGGGQLAHLLDVDALRRTQLFTAAGGQAAIDAALDQAPPQVRPVARALAATLRGVSFEGTTEIVDDPNTIFRVGVSVWERYTGPYTDEMKPGVDMMMNKRVAVRLVAERTRSWDHRKLGMPAMPLAGSTAMIEKVLQ